MPDQTFSATVKRFYGSSVIILSDDGLEQSAETNSRNKSLVCGDRVKVENRAGGCFVVYTEPRQTEFFRTDGFGRRKVIAANVDQIALVLAPLPEPHTRVVDRYWVAARNCDIPLALVVNKSDLDSTNALDEVIALYTKLGLPIAKCSAKPDSDLSSLIELLHGKASVFVGQSGVGKSSLVNRLSEQAGAKVGGLSENREEGRHTTTTTDFYEIAQGTRILDSPGIREFGLDHYDQPLLERGFVEIAEAAAHCRFRDCNHTNTPGCAVEAAAQSGEIDPRRLENYRHLLAQLS